MPAVAAHCLAYSKVVSAATVRTFPALLKTMRLNPRRESNPFFRQKKVYGSGRLVRRINMRSEETGTHARTATSCPPRVSPRCYFSIQSPLASAELLRRLVRGSED